MTPSPQSSSQSHIISHANQTLHLLPLPLPILQVLPPNHPQPAIKPTIMLHHLLLLLLLLVLVLVLVLLRPCKPPTMLQPLQSLKSLLALLLTPILPAALLHATKPYPVNATARMS